MVNKNKIVSVKIKHQAKIVFLSDVERTIGLGPPRVRINLNFQWVHLESKTVSMTILGGRQFL